MKKLSELSIYDDANQKTEIKNSPPPLFNIHDVKDRALYKLIYGPVKCVKYHTKKWYVQSTEYVTRNEFIYCSFNRFVSRLAVLDSS